MGNPTRSRSQYKPVQSVNVVVTQNYYGSIKKSQFTRNISGPFETISDCNKTPFLQNPVIHSTINYTLGTAVITQRKWPGLTETVDSEASYIVSNWLRWYNWSVEPSKLLLGDLLAAMGDSYLPNMAPDVNLTNFVRELVDFRSLFKSSLFTAVRASTEAVRVTTKMGRHFFINARKAGFSKADIKSYLKGVASDYLCYSFGWAPMVSDIKTMQKTVTSLLQQHKKMSASFTAKDGLPWLRKSSSKSVVLSSVTTAPHAYDGFFTNVAMHTYASVNTTLTVRRTVKFRWAVDHYNPTVFFLRSLVSKLGLHCIFGTLFEAIPFSFVVDWFIPVSSYFNKADSFLQYQPSFEIGSSIMSYKASKTAKLYCRPCESDKITVTKEVPSTITSSYYNRSEAGSSYYPTDPRLVPGTGLNGKRVSYLAAMAVQKL